MTRAQKLAKRRLLYAVKQYSKWDRVWKYPGNDKGITYKRLIQNLKKAAIEFTILHGLCR